MTFEEVPSFIDESIDQLEISKFGYRANDGIPFITLRSGLTFYGAPIQLTENESNDLLDVNKYVSQLVQGTIQLINNIRIRYYGNGREFCQHSRYTYKPGDVVLELGAYYGFYSLYIAERVGPSGTVIPVELVPDNYRILDLNMRANFPDRATALNVGIDSGSGEKRAFVGRDQIAGFQEEVVARFLGQSYQSVAVRTETVDNIVNDHGLDTVDMVIVQINGHEIAAFEGMQESLPKIKNMAIASPYNSTDTLSERLRRSGFDVEIGGGKWIYASREGF